MKYDYQDLGRRIQEGALVIFPTDTVYGIAASIHSELAIEKLYRAKSRKFSSPLIALVDSYQRIEEIALLEEAEKKDLELLASAFWPGGLTLILRAKAWIPKIMISGGDTIGVRIPNHEMALELIAASGGILPTTSANISGEASPDSYESLSQEICKQADIVLDGGACSIGEPSTILDMTKNSLSILREGSIKKEQIEAVLGRKI